MTEEKRKTFGRRLTRGTLLGVVPVIGAALGFYIYANGGRYIETENAYVKSEIVTLSANVDGQVVEVYVDDNQAVERGQLLFRLDPRPFEIALSAAEADLRNAVQQIEALRAHYRQGREELAVARERIRFLEGEYARESQLLKKKVGTQARYDRAQHDLFLARRHLSVAEETNRMILAELGGDPEAPLEAHPLYLKARSEMERAELNLSYASISAPISGTLSSVTLESGEYIEAGDPLFALVSSQEPWIEANLKEVQLTHLRIGQPATVVIDGYPDVTWEARVESIAPATGAEFAILPPQNATGNWVKVVQRVPVRLRLLDQKAKQHLRAGMTVKVSIDSGREREALRLIRGVMAGGGGKAQ